MEWNNANHTSSLSNDIRLYAIELVCSRNIDRRYRVHTLRPNVDKIGTEHQLKQFVAVAHYWHVKIIRIRSPFGASTRSAIPSSAHSIHAQ